MQCLSIFLFLRSILNHHLFSNSSSFSIMIILLTSYFRISSEQPNYHPSSPQRSHTLSLIPSHTSRTKLGSAAVKTTFSSSTSSSVQYTQSSSSSTQSTQSTGSSTQSTQSNGSSAQSGSSVRFNTESTNTSTGRGTLAVQYNNNQPGKRINPPLGFYRIKPYKYGDNQKTVERVDEIINKSIIVDLMLLKANSL